MKCLFLFLLSLSIYSQAQESNPILKDQFKEPVKPSDGASSATSLEATSPKKIILAGGDEGGGITSSGNGGGKVNMALSDYDKDMINLGVECAGAIGASIPEKKSIDTIASSIESKISNNKPSRSIASSYPDSCAVFSSQTSSVLLKRKFLRDEPTVVNPSKIDSGSSLSK